MKHKFKKHILIPVISGLLIISSFLYTSPVCARVLYETKQSEIVVKGVNYDYIRQATTNGLLDIHILTVDINNPYIDIKTLQPENYGTRETVTSLLNNSGAIAGINGDFFDTSASPVSAFGPVVSGGSVLSLNRGEQGYASFFIDDGNNPFIEYIYPDIQFLNNGQINLKIQAYNKFFNDFTAVIYDRNAIFNTAAFDARWPDLVKFVVENDIITYIGTETVTVPENGYIVLAAATYAQHFYESVRVGHKAEMKIEAKVDFNKLNTAIGGAGKLVENGVAVNNGYVVAPNNRHPRSAIGVSQDGSKVIMAVVDGRSHSMGATHVELANAMIRSGAYSAMHLDGGGSSTMAVNVFNDNTALVVNTLSDGSQRRVVNALGVFNNAPIGPVSSIMIEIPDDVVFNGSAVNLSVFGLDNHYNKIDITGVNFSSTDINGRFEGNVFFPATVGKISITAELNGMTYTKEIENLLLAELVPNRETLNLSVGQSANLAFTGISTTGMTGRVSGVKYEVFPTTLGTVTDNTFTVVGGESGYIKAYIGDIVRYIDVLVGTRLEAVNSFNTPFPVEFVASSDLVTGKTFFTDTINTPGNNAIALEYRFSESEATQAAYTRFNSPITIKEGASAIRLAVFGDNSGNWLRARLLDANGAEHIVDLARSVNFIGWQHFTANIPSEAVQPVSVERIYIASLSNTDTYTKTIYFDDLMALYPTENLRVESPASSRYINPLKTNLTGAPAQGFDITFIGDISTLAENKPANYASDQANALNRFRENARKGFLAGRTDIEEITGFDSVNMAGYKFNHFDNVAVVRMNAPNGRLTPTDWIFINESLSSTAEHIILVLDKMPSNFTFSKEYELFRNGCEELVRANKNVFVVTTEGFKNSQTVINGVNYINIGGLFNADDSVNTDFSILRFRINGRDIKFDIQNIF